ncbi:MAG: hypothetical protein UU09_C0016G0007 [Microgenomates group bacterium GW2011_GWA2_40_6]|nr:MAG: hypothetical protein UU09_C0016G0007 [Microgenomates group bacterium GW2011_GWA2_40_6]
MLRQTIDRRDFLKLATAGVAGMGVDRLLKFLEGVGVRGVEAKTNQETVGAVIGATPLEGGGWSLQMSAGNDLLRNRKVKIFEVPVTIVEQSSSYAGGRLGMVSKRVNFDGSYVEVRDVSTERVHSTTAFVPDWNHKRVVAEGNGTRTVPDLGTDKMYVMAFCGDNFEPSLDRWLPFSATWVPDLRFPTNVVL